MKHYNEFDYKVPYWNPAKGYLKIRDEVLAKVDEINKKGEWILGPEVDEFEKNLAAYVGKKYAIGLNSGTDALYLSLKALGIGRGDEVITVSNTFVASISEIARTGAKPVLVDIGDDYLMDTSKLPINGRTKAIIPVHLSGDFVPKFDRSIPIIEDAAQALGAKGLGYGLTQCWSFYPAKILGAYGDAGAITTDSKEIYDEIRELRDHYNIGKKLPSFHVRYGMNSRLDNLQAGILNIKLKYIQEALAHRKEAAMLYTEGLKELPLILPQEKEGRVWQDYIIRVPGGSKQLGEYLDAASIKVRGFNLYPNHSYKDLKLNFNLPLTDQFIPEFLRLPLSAEVTKEEIDTVISKIKEFYA